MKLKSLTRISVLSCIALIMFVIESQIPPPIPVAGIKLGLANVVILYTMKTMGTKEALIVMLMKIFLGNLLTGTVVSLIYSLAGGILCFVAQAIILKITSDNQLWAVSVTGAIAHNIGQLIAATVLVGTEKILWYLTILVPVAIITGAFIGLVTMYTIKAFGNIKISKE